MGKERGAVGAGRSDVGVGGANLCSGATLVFASHRGVVAHPKSRVRQPGGLRDPGDEMARLEPVDIEKVLSDSVGLESRLDCVGDHLNLAGTAWFDEGVVRPLDWVLFFLDLVALRMT